MLLNGVVCVGHSDLLPSKTRHGKYSILRALLTRQQSLIRR